MSKTAEDSGTCIYLHFADDSPVEEEEITLSDGRTASVLWKDVLVEGEYPMTPGPDGAVDQPMRVITDGESDRKSRTISMSDIEFAHDDGAFKYVTIPLTHQDRVLDNTGYVPRPNGLRRVTKRGKTVLQAALGFTEPDIKGKVQRGTIPDVSAGIFFNWLNKATKKRYRCAMKHVNLTPTPFMGNLDPFPAIFAADDELSDSTSVEVYSFADGDGEEDSDNNSDKKGEIVWDEFKSMSWLSQQVGAALRPKAQTDDGRPFQEQPYYYVQDVAPDRALVQEEFKGNVTKLVIPFTVKDGGVELAPQTRWIEAKEAMIAASDDTDFAEVEAGVIREKLSIKLSEDFGSEGFQLSVEGVSLDKRARIKNTTTGSEFLAAFFVDDGEVRIAPSDQWESVKAPDKTQEEQPPASVGLSDTPPLSRLEAARQRRRQLVAAK